MGSVDKLQLVQAIVAGLEVIGIVVIALAFIYALIRVLVHMGQKKENAYESLKIFIGKALLLGLEFLVAADIVRTVSVVPTLEGIVSLGLLVVVRTFLSWSLAVEIDGCWPWQVAQKKGRL